MIIRNVHMPAGDLSDLYILIRNFRSVYNSDNELRYRELNDLMADIEYIYAQEYPDLPSILENRNTRFAGRKKTYNKTFENEIIDLYHQGKGPTEIAKEKGCSKSYVSKLIGKQPR